MIESDNIEFQHLALEKKEHIDLPNLIFLEIQDHIKSADNKALLILTANGVLAGLFSSLINELSAKHLGQELVLIAIILIFLPILLSTFFSLVVVKLHLTVPHTANLFYFGSIQNQEQKSFMS